MNTASIFESDFVGASFVSFIIFRCNFSHKNSVDESSEIKLVKNERERVIHKTLLALFVTLESGKLQRRIE